MVLQFTSQGYIWMVMLMVVRITLHYMMPGVENLESYSLDGKGMVYNKSSHGEGS